MASLQAAEDGYDFVEKPSDDFFCPVTYELLRKPYFTPCCGNHLSTAAVANLQGQPCPVCKEANLNPVPDKFFKCKVNELKVRCPNKSLWCEWVGALGDLDRHLSQNSVEGECQFVTVACPYACGEHFQRCQLEGHKVCDCPNRPFMCQCCGHEDTYNAVTNEHWLICAKYPVDCPLGCQWVGEQGNLDQHLNDGFEEGECPLVTVPCSYDCGWCFQRCHLQEHKAKECFTRPFTCQYCDYKATYIKVINEHLPICKRYILKCTNQCGANAIERQHLPKHLEETCPLQMIKCEFSYAGCEVECQRSCMQTHLTRNKTVHLSLVSSSLVALRSKTEQLQSTVNEQQKQIITLTASLARASSNMHRPIAPSFVPPLDMLMTGFEEHRKRDYDWLSPPFYSHNGGYKLCCNVVANGCGVHKGTHVSVYVYLMRGEHDDNLKWPFRGAVTIQLLNRKNDEGHKEATINCNDAASDEYAGRVVGQERADGGWGSPSFIAHSDLLSEDREYLQNDCLKFRILKVVFRSI